MNFRFESPWWFLALVALPLLEWYRRRTAREAVFVYSSLTLVKGILQMNRTLASRVLLAARWLGLALLIVGMARPQWAVGKTPRKASGIDIAVALDLSGSMLSEDFELQGERVDRVTVAKDTLKAFIENRPNDRIGLAVFSSHAYIAAPPTLDHDFLRRHIDRMEVLGEQGTAIGAGLSAAVNRLRDLKSKSRIVILLTDGQNNAGNVPPLTAAEAAQSLGVKVYTIGVGIRGTAPMPVGRDAFGRKVYRQVAVDIDEDTLTRIAERTGGKYFRADSTKTLRSIYEEIDRLEKTEVETHQNVLYAEWMVWCVAPGVALLLLELIVGNTVWRRLP
ncbi:MAG: VWA domain-containing protein [Pedosphaera sp.]|jgi:Ca-activated chloride channel family protein|nr:VWA domain-containing protein [Pedosphaera sp.]